jgi:hypothetical protein
MIVGCWLAACGAGVNMEEREAAHQRTRAGAGAAFDDLDGKPQRQASLDARRQPGQAEKPAPEQLKPAEAAPQVEYDQARYMLGLGASRQGQAEAEKLAMADLANQISSTVKSDLTVTAGTAGGKEFESIVEDVRQHSEFAHAELIRVDRARGTCDDQGLCRAMALLERAEALDVLGGGYRRDAEVFRRAAAAALAASADVQAFTPRFREAEEAFARMLPSALQMRVIGGAPFPDAREDEARFRELLAARSQVLAGLRLVIRREGTIESDVWEALGNSLAGAFSQLGLATTTGDGCGGGLGLAVQASLACSRGFFGPRCTLEASGVLSSCAAAKELAPLDLSSGRTKAAAAHPRQDDLARRAALDKLTRDALAPILRAQVMHVLPVR